MANYLETQAVGTVGTDIFVNKLPQQSDLPVNAPVLTVYDSGGFDPAVNINRKHFVPTVQIVVTGTANKYTDAETLALLLQDTLTDAVAFVAAPFTYYGSYQQGDTVFLGYDENNRPEFSLNFRLFRRKDR